MSKPDEAAVHAWLDAVKRRDLDGALAYYADDVENTMAQRGYTLRGKDQLRKVLETFFQAIPDRTVTVRSLTLGDNGRCVMEYDQDGTVGPGGTAVGLEPGTRYHREWCAVAVWRDGRIVSERVYNDSPDA
ncbi:nuclear transport factor 2 family protein [Nocardia neocaledoniensis]|uniref:nuclear transport factor 2 family protein n=1 Tax=Nocardia neocaledoniensis TaxID=236511 RepID=UPI0024583567|nr:nuclear transport factor 2 family protein [Nocardia neocaledoniensis]